MNTVQYGIASGPENSNLSIHIHFNFVTKIYLNQFNQGGITLYTNYYVPITK